MYQPNYSITNKILNHIVKIDVTKSQVATKDLGYDVRSRLTQKMINNNVFFAAAMIGLKISTAEAKKIAEGERLETDDDRYHLLYAITTALELNRAAKTGEEQNRMDLELLASINNSLVSPLMSPSRLRANQSDWDNQFESWGNYRDINLDISTLHAELSSVLDWFGSEAHRIHVLVRIPLMVIRLVNLMPFFTLNKYTLILLVDKILTDYSYINTMNYPVFKLFLEHEQRIWKSWDAAYRSGDLTVWLEEFTEILAEELDTAATAIQEQVNQLQNNTSAQPFLDLNKRQMKVLRYLQNIPTVRREDYCQMMDVSTMTAYRDMNDLVEKGLLKIEGKGRGTKYKLASR